MVKGGADKYLFQYYKGGGKSDMEVAVRGTISKFIDEYSTAIS